MFALIGLRTKFLRSQTRMFQQAKLFRLLIDDGRDFEKEKSPFQTALAIGVTHFRTVGS
ncbi:hypothetical protein IFT84_17745 [Rhizobium sp. CFBP 8762]|uniref:hypothetical protein n=1 Tax=Rhizobium sp. CFBP 8762 TaxID=2775279 RepID=UPI00177DD0A3|nr:hypothetical protein [Rhizobium sp. CFBP 8762]MBD8556355.1 hypothetical protein [Rhizobium sp. CFBP 8762]